MGYAGQQMCMKWLEEPQDNEFKGQEHENSDKWLLHGGGIYVA